VERPWWRGGAVVWRGEVERLGLAWRGGAVVWRGEVQGWVWRGVVVVQLSGVARWKGWVWRGVVVVQWSGVASWKG